MAVLYESTEGNEDFDISDSLAEIEAVQETFQLLSEDGEIDINNFDIDAAVNIASNAADIEESKKAIKLAKDAGIDATEIAKKDVDEQKAINKVAEKLEAAGGADAAKNFSLPAQTTLCNMKRHSRTTLILPDYRYGCHRCF